MKRFTGMLLALAFVFAGTYSYATSTFDSSIEDDPKIVSKVIDLKALKVQLVNLQKETTIVKLEDMSGTEFYRRTIKDHNGFARRLDLNQLDNGRYMLKIEQGSKQWVQVVLVDDDQVRVSKIVSK